MESRLWFRGRCGQRTSAGELIVKEKAYRTHSPSAATSKPCFPHVLIGNCFYLCAFLCVSDRYYFHKRKKLINEKKVEEGKVNNYLKLK